jgi:hypothetical protein
MIEDPSPAGACQGGMVRDLRAGVKLAENREPRTKNRVTMDDGRQIICNLQSTICNFVKISPKTGVAGIIAMLHYLCIDGFARIQEGDVARMAKLFILTGATTRAR